MTRSIAQKINYAEGTCFFVPLRDGGFARGIVTRLSGDGRIFAYFFGPKLDQMKGSFDGLKVQNAKLLGLCGDLGLLKGEWVRAGSLKGWCRDDWPLPALYREDVEQRLAWLSHYSDDNLNFVCEESVSFGHAMYADHPYDRLMGYGAVEIRLTKLLS